MKAGEGNQHPWGTVELTLAEAPPALDVVTIHAAHAGFVWSALQRFGVRDADLEDALQEVFVVVHQRLASYDPTVRVTTWLYGIALRVAASFRRRAHVRRERIVDHVPDVQAMAPRPEDAAADCEARERLLSILDSMDLEKRAVLVMFEIDGLSCDEIAAVAGVPVGTVYSRLHAARQAFQQSLLRWTARDAHRGRP